MTGRMLSIISALATLRMLAGHHAYAQSAKEKPATLELGDVSIQAVETGTPTKASRPPATQSRSDNTIPDVSKDVATPRNSAVVPSNSRTRSKAAAEPKMSEGYSSKKPERIEFKRHPVRVVLGNEERLVTFPHPVAISLPAGAQTNVDMQIIGRTAYFTRLTPRTAPIRALAEDLVTGQTIPLDLLGMEQVVGINPEVEIYYAEQPSAGQQSVDIADEKIPELDMVQLTRFAAQAVYAPRRLRPASDGVNSIPLDSKNVDGLFRGVRTRSTPLGQWRSGDLYVTAVQVNNLEKRPILLEFEQIRGRWIAATLQHHSIHAMGSDFDSTTLYLVCSQPFQSCR